MAVKIKLKRMGKIRTPYYRIIVADARTKRDGRAIEEIGRYHPKAEPSLIEVDSQRAQHWLSVGAQPTDPVRRLLEVTGDWQKFKNLPGAEGTLRSAAPAEDKKERFAAAVAETLAASGAKPKKAGAKAADEQPASSGAKAASGKHGKAAGGKAGDSKAGDSKAGGKSGAGGGTGSVGESEAEGAGGSAEAPEAAEPGGEA